MLLYTNHTRTPAIVTIKIENAENPDASVMIGTEAFYEKLSGKSGYHDVVVESGKELPLDRPLVGDRYAFSADRQHVASSAGKTLRIWSVKTGKVEYEEQP